MHLRETGIPVAIARNRLAQRALALDPRPEFALWVDADAWWPQGTVQRKIGTMHRRPEIDLFCGYFGGRDQFSEALCRRYPGDRTSFPKPGIDCNFGAVVEVAEFGFHFVLHRLAALEHLGENPFATNHPRGCNEDIMFCSRARSVGLRLFAATDSCIAHIDVGGRANIAGEPSGRIVRNAFVCSQQLPVIRPPVGVSVGGPARTLQARSYAPSELRES